MGAVELSEAAERDLSDIWFDIAVSRGARTADRWVDRIEQRCGQLSGHPESGPARPEIAPLARCLTVSRWLILYQIVPNGVRVNRIVDGARDFRKLDFPGLKPE